MSKNNYQPTTIDLYGVHEKESEDDFGKTRNALGLPRVIVPVNLPGNQFCTGPWRGGADAFVDIDPQSDERMANNRGEPITPEPVREMVLVLHRDAWGAPVSPEEHEALCASAEAWLTEHEGDCLSIRVRPSRDGETEGLRVLRYGVLDEPDLRRSEDDLAALTNRAWDHAAQSAHEILKR